jgi:hypothetical protein
MSSVPLGLILSRRMGWRLEGRVLRRRVKASKHLLRLPEPGWCFDANVFEMLRPGFDAVEVADVESGMTYRIAAADFDAAAQRIDRGFGPQSLVPLRLWTASRRMNTQLALALETAS